MTYCEAGMHVFTGKFTLQNTGKQRHCMGCGKTQLEEVLENPGLYKESFIAELQNERSLNNTKESLPCPLTYVTFLEPTAGRG